MSASVVVNAAGPGLAVSLKRSEHWNRMKAFGLVIPLLLFILITFMVPIVELLFNSVDNSIVPSTLPNTTKLLKEWQPENSALPGETVFKALSDELRAGSNLEISKLGSRFNYVQSGTRSLFTKTARRLGDEAAGTSGSAQERLVAIDARWGKTETWALIRNYSGAFTAGYYLTAFDLRFDPSGSVAREAEDSRLYLDVFARTFLISAAVTVICLLLAYPVAYLLANIPARIGNLLMILVLLPFWTSILVRTTAWVVLLQTEGLVNQALLYTGLAQEPLKLIFNRLGVLIAMTHILLPYAILSLYSVMKGISPVYVRAARSLGAGPIRSFIAVYFPQTMPGVSAAGMLVFILALGYYITPAMVGGGDDQMVSYFVADQVNTTLNWGLASALGMMLLLSVTVLYMVYTRLVGGNGMKLG